MSRRSLWGSGYIVQPAVHAMACVGVRYWVATGMETGLTRSEISFYSCCTVVFACVF